MEMLKKLFAPVDMTVGKPWKDIVLFTVPMLLGNIAQQLYNTVDSVVVGNYVGDNALAAVGSAGPLVNLLIVLFVGISVGASIMVAQYFGARDREALSHTIGNCIDDFGLLVCDGSRSTHSQAYADTFENTGKYSGLVYVLSAYYVLGSCRDGLLQHLKRCAAWVGRFCLCVGVSGSCQCDQHCVGSCFCD